MIEGASAACLAGTRRTLPAFEVSFMVDVDTVLVRSSLLPVAVPSFVMSEY